LVSSGYRVPNTDDVTKIFGSTPGKVIVPNVDLKTEKTINYEIGFTKIFNQKTRWENSLYYTQYFDIAVVDTFRFNNKDSILYDGTLSRVYANQNKNSAYIYGFSSNLITCIDKNFTMAAGVNYTYGRIKTDSSDVPLDHIAPLLARVEFTYHFNKLSTSLFAIGNGAKKLKDYYLNGEDNEQYATDMGMPAWICLNFHASYEASSKIMIQGGINNLFDTQYRTFASGINAPGRNLFISVRAKF
jgi:hemoglobin/transferrin/lactoferrin receptor protein